MPKTGGKLTKKEARFVKAAIVPGVSLSEAANEAYDTRNPDVIAAEVYRRPRVFNAIQHALRNAGVTEDALAKVHADAIKATQKDFQGNESPDHTTRLKGADQAAKLAGYYAPERKEVTQVSIIETLARKVADEETPVEPQAKT